MATAPTMEPATDTPADVVADHERGIAPVPVGPEAHKSHISTLGHLRLRDEDTNQIILIPNPSEDPNDPLNWKVYPGHTTTAEG